MTIGRLLVIADRWPWQGYGWSSSGFRDPMYGRDLGRFGGGWRWSLGIQAGGRMVLITLLIGQIMLTWARDGGEDE